MGIILDLLDGLLNLQNLSEILRTVRIRRLAEILVVSCTVGLLIGWLAGFAGGEFVWVSIVTSGLVWAFVIGCIIIRQVRLKKST